MSLLKVQREGDGSTFVWLHGFTQTRDSAYQFRSILAGSHELWTMDLPGHGDAHAIEADLLESADLVADALPRVPVDIGGYSFGGRVAAHLAIRHPQLVRRLVLLGATRGIEHDAERATRRARDELLAERIEELGVDDFLNEWLAQPLFATLHADPRERLARSKDAHGLASSLRHAGTGTQEWLEGHLAQFNSPTLALAGELDLKFTQEAKSIAATVRHGTWAIVPGAGHAAHVEQPERTSELINQFLKD